MPRVLLVEDEDKTVKYFKIALQKKGIGVTSFESLEELRKEYDRLQDYDLIVIDLRLDRNGWNISGRTLLKEMYARCPKPLYVIWSAYVDTEQGYDALQDGATLVLFKDGNINKFIDLAQAGTEISLN